MPRAMPGINFVVVAKKFLKDFSIGSQLSTDEFDTWAQSHGYLNVPLGAPKDSDAWMAHLQRRHIFRNKLNRASVHKNMPNPYVVEYVEGILVVRSPVHAIAEDRTMRRLQTLIETRRKNLYRLKEAVDWTMLPEHARDLTDMFLDDIDHVRDNIKTDVEHLDQKFSRLRDRVRRAITDGTITNPGQAIQELAGPEPEEDDE